MAARSQHAIMVAAVVVGVAALAGIAALEGWLTLPGATTQPAAPPAPRPRITATPAESLLPGETIVEAPAASAPPPPAPVTPRPPPASPQPKAAPAAPQARPAPVTPSYAQQAPAPERRSPRASCPNCGEVASTTYRQFERSGAWEVRVRFDDGTRATLRYPTDPGFRVGERVVMSEGRLRRN